MRFMTSVLVASLLVVSTLAHAQTDKKKANAAGLTSEVGNRCPGGTFDKCQAAVVKSGTSARNASAHCAKTCK